MIAATRCTAAVIAGFILASCAAAHFPDVSGVTAEEVQQITPVVRAHTPEPIRFITRRSDGTVEVDTGSVHTLKPGPEFRLRKTHGAWRITQTLVRDHSS